MSVVFSVEQVDPKQRAAGIWTAALLHALIRDELKGGVPLRLTEPGLATWKRFRGRLGVSDFISLLFEDAAVLHRIPFDPIAVGGAVLDGELPEEMLQAWIAGIPNMKGAETPPEYIAMQAALLGLPRRFARADLHVVKPHHKVLELPGTGGQLAHHLVSAHPDLSLGNNFTVACASWQELTMAGIVALDVRAPATTFIERVAVASLADASHPLRNRRFDFVLGLSPEKGGLFRIEDQLAIWYSGARLLLV